MEKSYYLSMTFNNIVFKGRNKLYGAYALRKAYNRHIFLAAILATTVFSGALVGPLVDAIFFADQVKYEKPTYTIVEPIPLYLPEPPKPEPAKSETPPPAPAGEKKVATEKFVTPKVVDDNTPAVEDIPNQEDLLSKNIGTEKIEGELPEIPATTITDAPPVGIEGGTGEISAPPTTYIHVEQMPQFKGGTSALAAYLSKKIRYPDPARRNGVEGTVVVTFVVSTSGEITDVEVLKGLGFGTDEEAARVIKSMPKWEPGRQNGRNVPVRYTLPISFKIQ
ncbi:energy transducer TonB [Pontibacter korlensis]|uniref:TonB C-terminal domain-containing protein n=1 Tax=Pontibacter korlensis TaxID=400092 RepID=A0A0E3ZEW9_9BACT|nr:energy transducer TonB [Pontibacter korlensis]AKD02514.1 hypothetical protein PKOR_04475 [Pontibacter korlensis]